MEILLALLIVVVTLAVVSFTRPPDMLTRHAGTPRTLVRIVVGMLVVPTAFFLLFGIGEMLSGDLSGAMHLPPVAFIALLMWVTYRTPFESGIGLLVIGVFNTGYLLFANRDLIAMSLVPIALLGVPFLICGALAVLAALIARGDRTIHSTPQGHA
jgi:hypothetical protein